MPKPGAGGRLDKYRRKRLPSVTPEPFGEAGSERPGLFVVQKHAASHTHYDLRLEMAGVLVSWAVPKGPSLDPADKRLAVATEDHPLEYADFEGVIPEGNYGAGSVIVWDQGLATHHLDPEEGLETGKLLFELKGYKLRGLFTLVRTKRSPREWLLIKKPDAEATGETAEQMNDGSVFSGLTVEELRKSSVRAQEMRTELADMGARRRHLRADQVKVMLAQLKPQAFSKKGWIFELKYDGYRVVAGRSQPVVGAKPEARLFYRSGREATPSYPDLLRALRALPYDGLVLDGEVVVLDEEGKPSFQLLQKRAQLTRRRDIERAAVPLPAVLFVFDLLGLEGYDLRTMPLTERKRLLRQVLPAAGPLRYSDHIDERGEDMYQQVRQMGLEGLVAKRADSAYRGGRSDRWIKVRAERSGDFVVVGFTEPKGSRPGLGALHLAAYYDGELRYAGRVGTGFSDKLLTKLRRRLEPKRRETPAFVGSAPAAKEHVWVEPELAAEVRYIQYTEDGHLRHPVFSRLRDDKPLEDCIREDLPPQRTQKTEEPVANVDERPTVDLTRPEKVFWPAEGYTKGDLDSYYQAVTPWLLPLIADRPVVLDRYPDGIDGKNFFQKNAPGFVPEWIRTEPVWTEDEENENNYLICNDEQSLRYLVNLGAIPLHIWQSRLQSLQDPDWCVLDLDAKAASFADVVTTARTIKRLCDSIGLSCFVKTSGATGMHVLVPLAGAFTHEQSKQLAQLLARVTAGELPDITSIARRPAAREGKIYLDFGQNGYGKLIVAPYSVRPLPGATASTPLRWSEVNSKLDPKRFTIKTVPARLRRMKTDPWAEILTTTPDLMGALGRLAKRVSETEGS
ncbi:MAG: DNA ligase D [Acidobacteriota bacterium]|nr:DNA ligase D [Acidobacteriota bacterium]